MSFEQYNTLELCCAHCFYNFTVDNHTIPNVRLLAVQLQMQRSGAEFGCPRCKGNFVAQMAPPPRVVPKSVLPLASAEQPPVVSTPIPHRA